MVQFSAEVHLHLLDLLVVWCWLTVKGTSNNLELITEIKDVSGSRCSRLVESRQIYKILLSLWKICDPSVALQDWMTGISDDACFQ